MRLLLGGDFKGFYLASNVVVGSMLHGKQPKISCKSKTHQVLSYSLENNKRLNVSLRRRQRNTFVFSPRLKLTLTFKRSTWRLADVNKTQIPHTEFRCLQFIYQA